MQHKTITIHVKKAIAMLMMAAILVVGSGMVTKASADPVSTLGAGAAALYIGKEAVDAAAALWERSIERDTQRSEDTLRHQRDCKERTGNYAC